MFREERKHKLKKLTKNENLKQNAYILIHLDFTYIIHTLIV
jgi:hypothetical protein